MSNLEMLYLYKLPDSNFNITYEINGQNYTANTYSNVPPHTYCLYMPGAICVVAAQKSQVRRITSKYIDRHKCCPHFHCDYSIKN